MVIQHDAQRGNQRRVVLQRFAHAHHDDVGNHPVLPVQAFSQKVLGKPELRDDFTGGQVAAEALVPGGAEPAPDCAARLR